MTGDSASGRGRSSLKTAAAPLWIGTLLLAGQKRKEHENEAPFLSDAALAAPFITNNNKILTEANIEELRK